MVPTQVQYEPHMQTCVPGKFEDLGDFLWGTILFDKPMIFI
jgi:hypothetical protein